MNKLIYVLVAVRLVQVFTSLIGDCDEVFNYWEPLNFLLRNFGKQTWEYSPEYAIRSWAFLLPFAAVLKPFTLLADWGLVPSYVAFYVGRLMCVLFSIYGEITLYNTLVEYVSANTATWFLVFDVFNTGMSHASIALLPSSFAMCCVFCFMSNFIKYLNKKDTRHALIAVSWVALGGIMGWPFVLALCIPVVVHFAFTHSIKITAGFVMWCAVISLFYLGVVVEIDTNFFYKKTVFVPLNIVLYNVIFANEETGPDIFGTEPLSYYFKNLALNFNLVAVLCFLGLIIVPVLSWKRGLLLSPLALWFGVFFSQPHKEERFLYPVYSLVCLSAAFAFDEVLHRGSAILSIISRPLAKIYRVLLIGTTLFLFVILSLSRSIGLVINYTAPLQVFKHIPADASGNVCSGREWYHYPSSFFLPANTRYQFVKSGFDGLLPGNFLEGIGVSPAVQALPEGMNNANRFDPGKLVLPESCEWYVDIGLETSPEDIISLDDLHTSWEPVQCFNFINFEESNWGRIFWLPQPLASKLGSFTTYHQYCLYRKSDTPKHVEV